MKIEVQFGSDGVGQNTEKAIKSWHLSWWITAREGRAALKFCGYRKVKGPENTQALSSLEASMDTQNIFKDFVSVKSFVLSPWRRNYGWLGLTWPKPNPLDGALKGSQQPCRESN